MNISFSFAQKSDELALKRLFLNCFDDTLGFVNMFFLHHFIPENTVAGYLDDKIAAMAFLLPCRVDEGDCLYAYGICVDGEMRGCGVGLRLMEFLLDTAKKRGAELVLHPADQKLFGFYEKAGLHPCGSLSKRTLTPACEAAELRPVTPQEYCALRDRLFAGDRPLCWDVSSTEYALMQETFFGFSYYKVTENDRTDIVLCGLSDGQAFIKETSADGETLEKIAAAVCKKYYCDSVIALLPEGRQGDEKIKVGYGTISHPIYMNLLLD